MTLSSNQEYHLRSLPTYRRLLQPYQTLPQKFRHPTLALLKCRLEPKIKGLKQVLCNIRRSQERDRTRDYKFVFEGVFECFLPIFDLENTILGIFSGVFESRFGYRGPEGKFQKSSRHPKIYITLFSSPS